MVTGRQIAGLSLSLLVVILVGIAVKTMDEGAQGVLLGVFFAALFMLTIVGFLLYAVKRMLDRQFDRLREEEEAPAVRRQRQQPPVIIIQGGGMPQLTGYYPEPTAQLPPPVQSTYQILGTDATFVEALRDQGEQQQRGD